MIDVNLLREKKEEVKKALTTKNSDSSLADKAFHLDLQRRKLLQEIEKLREQRNKLSKKKELEKGKKIREEIKKLELKFQVCEKKFLEVFTQIPNLPLKSVPVGKSDKENVEIRRWGKPRKFNFPPKDHLEIGKRLRILDFETGAKVTGSQFYFLYKEAALLELALVEYAFELLQKEGFVLVITPDLAKSRYWLGTGYLPKGKEAQTYVIEGKDLGLIATAEVTLAGKHADEIIFEDKLPLKYAGYSHCFRQEAGSYGKYSKGLYRVHQFTKVEMFIYSKPEDSERMHQYLLSLEEKIYRNLGLPYRVVEMCTGDLGAMAARKFDIEIWMPSRGEYGEVTSTSNCTDYQARNLNIRIRRKDGKVEYLHMLNGTAIATSRTILAILENYQEKDGSVIVPKVLRKWVGKDKITV